MEVRSAAIGDTAEIAPLVAALSSELGIRVESPDLMSATALVMVARVDGGIVGYAHGEIGDGLLALSAVFVEAAYRGNGMGSRLLDELARLATARDIGLAEVVVPTARPELQRFFQVMAGFNVRGVVMRSKLSEGEDRYTVNEEQPWYSVRSHFRLPDDGPFDYEERITLWRAASFDEALERAALEATSYARTNGYELLDSSTAYHLADTGFTANGLEVWSEMRASPLGPEDYLRQHFFTGEENSVE